ncbi:MAG: SLBB domain-containing protein, partial [Myxococcales bacterium]|nr:SLBB domain-containing protein [Myxococcales bacterium]
PTLVHNVETIACVPPIVLRGADWFRAAGRSGAGTKLYSLSGHVRVPGVYELPLGASLDELAELAGGYLGELKAFSPGGASSGFLPASERGRALDFRGLSEIGSMLGSAGVVVLNESVNMARAALQQLLFFEEESCGQCAPCRIGTRFVREALERYLAGAPAADALAPLDDVAFQMQEGSICGLGQTAYLPLTSARRWFPEEFR